ncbi:MULTISPECIES: DUF2626 domain-containing protein [Alteribacillus]|uniref:DUF2626 domain-containing protein n=1 Tax=Alteribacillus bidgolensis TaxID=930129 RepID=A0A1G8BM17_9BACI|nr:MULTISPECIES: DUF2626 domain-containing protein [Alteribacillus]SDH34257.1 Protein of unknown function [Alteribacillus bidgolensis]
MDRMFRMMGFWTAVFAILFFVGDMFSMAILFFAQTAGFLALGYMRLTERMYIYIFGAYLTVFFVGFTYYTTFLMEPGFH